MKEKNEKKLLGLVIFAFLINSAYANNINNNQNAKSQQYIKLGLGFGRQLATDGYSDSSNAKNFSELDFGHFVGSLAFGTDWYETDSKLPLRTEFDLALRSSYNVSYGSKLGTNSSGITKLYEAGMKVGLDTFMYNIYWDLHNDRGIPITPYIMGGFGLAIPFSIKDNIAGPGIFSTVFYNASTLAFAPVWSVGLGANIEITPNFVIENGLKYSRVGEASTSLSDSRFAQNPTYQIKSLESIEYQIGFRFKY